MTTSKEEFFASQITLIKKHVNDVFTLQGRIQADAWKPGLQRDFFKYGISPGLSEKKYEKQVILAEKRCWASTLHISWLRPCI